MEVTQEIVRAGPLEIRPADFLALGEGRLLSLTPTEFALLAALAQRAGRIVARGELYETVWERELPAHDRSVDVYVRKLRTKLVDALPGWRFIHTHVGLGYRFFPEPSQLFHTSATDA
jgi:DNA-binding response OmpR family regulator